MMHIDPVREGRQFIYEIAQESEAQKQVEKAVKQFFESSNNVFAILGALNSGLQWQYNATLPSVSRSPFPSFYECCRK